MVVIEFNLNLFVYTVTKRFLLRLLDAFAKWQTTRQKKQALKITKSHIKNPEIIFYLKPFSIMFCIF